MRSRYLLDNLCMMLSTKEYMRQVQRFDGMF